MENAEKKYNKLNFGADTINELEKLQKQFDALCDEQESLPRNGFAKVFEVLDKIDEAFTLDRAYTDNEDNINKALEMTGYNNDEAFCKAFKRNNQIIIEGKGIQERILVEISKSIPPESEPAADEWQFYPFRIIAPQPLMEVIAGKVETDAIAGKGLFENITDIPEDDEELDEYLMIDAFGLKCSFVPFLDELKRFNVADKFLSKGFTKCLFMVLKQEATFIKDNTTTPAKVKNHISKTITLFGEMPVWGLFFQILILQGLCRWLEGININEGDNGYNETQSLYDWLDEQLMKKEIDFCLKPYGENDKERLKPLCNYLYSTKSRQMVQNLIFNANTDKVDIGEPQQIIIPGNILNELEKEKLITKEPLQWGGLKIYALTL